jgi:hypothetical protein
VSRRGPGGARDTTASTHKLDSVRSLLDSLPLSTSDYGIAQNRLRNAERSLRSQERGAARFELQLLAGSLRNGTPV